MLTPGNCQSRAECWWVWLVRAGQGIQQTDGILLEQLGYLERCHNHCFNPNCFWLHHFFHWGRLSFLKYGGRLPFSKKLRSSSTFKNYWGCLPFSKYIEVIFHFQNKLRSSSIFKKLRSSSIFKKIEVVFHLKKNEVVFHFQKN